jgi:hypothetical protein
MQTLVSLPMQSIFGRDLCQNGITIYFHNSPLFGLLFKEGDNVSPTFLISLTSSSGLEWVEVNLAHEEHVDRTLRISAT